MIDRVDNETKEARLFLSQSNSTENKENVTTRARAVHLRAHMARMVTWSMQINSLISGDKEEYQSWWAAFSCSCVDETNFSVQFDMLRLRRNGARNSERIRLLGSCLRRGLRQV